MADAVTYCTFAQLGRHGRLGNQLFQIAGTIGLARKNGMDPLFPPDWPYRRVFSLPDEMFGTDEGIPAPGLAVDLDPVARGYLQDLKLWSEVADEVYEVLQFSSWAETQVHEQSFYELPAPLLSVHVRRGDNVQANDPMTPNKHLYHPLRPLSYYLSAIEHLRADVASVAVFGDDPEWNRANIPGDWYSNGVAMPKEHLPEYLTTVPEDWKDLYLMSLADRHVLSNSTFGIWAALLGDDPEAIYPANFYGTKVEADAHLMVPSTWIEWPCDTSEVLLS